VLQGFIDRIVKSDRLLALVAVNDAIAAHGNQKEVDKARVELSQGDRDIATGKYESGIEDYHEAVRRVRCGKMKTEESNSNPEPSDWARPEISTKRTKDLLELAGKTVILFAGICYVIGLVVLNTPPSNGSFQP